MFLYKVRFWGGYERETSHASFLEALRAAYDDFLDYPPERQEIYKDSKLVVGKQAMIHRFPELPDYMDR